MQSSTDIHQWSQEDLPQSKNKLTGAPAQLSGDGGCVAQEVQAQEQITPQLPVVGRQQSQQRDMVPPAQQRVAAAEARLLQHFHTGVLRAAASQCSDEWLLTANAAAFSNNSWLLSDFLHSHLGTRATHNVATGNQRGNQLEATLLKYGAEVMQRVAITHQIK